MTPEERKQAALAEITAVLQKYGCNLDVQITRFTFEPSTLVDAVTGEYTFSIKPRVATQMVVTAKADWQPQDTSTENTSTIVDSDNP